MNVPEVVRSAARRVPGTRRVVLTARFGNLGRTAPLKRWGREQGPAVDRWFIERYLKKHAHLVVGRVLEVKSNRYAARLGASEVEIVDIDPNNTQATVVGDLCDPTTLEARRYDAAIVTQTLQYVADPEAALRNLLTSLRPGGALLLTVPCLGQIDDPKDRWRWVPVGFGQLLAAVTPPGATVDIVGLGNGLVGRAFLFGLATEDLVPSALDVQDDEFPIVVGACVRLEV